MAARLYGAAFPLVDGTVIPDDQIMNHRSMAALTLLQKHIHRRDLSELLNRLTTTLLTGQQFVSLINYPAQADETDDAKAFVLNLVQKVPQHEEALMTIAQQLEQKGIEIGRQLGEMKGREEGKLEEKLEFAGKTLKNGYPLQSVKELTGLSDEILAEISH